MKPSFFIVGSPKCGTTSLAEYLSDHADIFVSIPKEPHFFADDFPLYKKELPNLDAYEALFDNSEARQSKIGGEASVWYMYSECAIRNIKNYQPDAKIIVMLRKPLEVVESLHKQMLWVLDEDDLDLESAWGKQLERSYGRSIPAACRESKFLQYKKIVHYSEQLKRIYSEFSEKQVKIILFDNFKENTLLVYKDVLKFLELDYDGRVEFKKTNERKKYINPLMAKFTQRPPESMVYLIKKIKKILGIKKLGIMSKMQGMNTEKIIDETSVELKSAINKELYQYISELEKLLDVDFKKWYD